LLMHEMLHWAALARLPIVMCNINRVVGPGWNIWADENDSISQRDTGWIQFYCSSNQEIFDTVIQAFKIAEHKKIGLPIMINYNAFILSHTSMPVMVPDQKDIDAFLPPYEPQWKLDVDNPVTHGNIIGAEYYEKIRRAQHEAQDQAKSLIPTIAKEWKEQFSTYHGDLLEFYQCEDADHILVAMGAIGAESKAAINKLREQGVSIGLARLRCFRPFPTEEIITLSKQADLIVIDRNISVGSTGAVYQEIKGALYGRSDANVTGFIAGLGGKDVTYKDIEKMCTKAIKEPSHSQIWYGFKED